MSAASVKTALTSIMDRLACGVENSKSIWYGQGTKFWSIVDASGDETFENTVKGTELTALDTDLSNARIGSMSVFSDVFKYIDNYLTNTYGSDSIPALKDYLDDVGIRVPYEFALNYKASRGSNYYFPTKYVFPKGIRPDDESSPANSGMHKFTSISGTTETVEDGELDTTIVNAAVILAIGTADAAASGTFLGELVDGTTKSISASLTNQYEQQMLGEVDITSITAGSADVTVDSASLFKANEYILIYESDDLQEVAKISSINGSVLTLDRNIYNTYTAAAHIYPMFVNVSYDSLGVGDIDLFAFPDRQVSM